MRNKVALVFRAVRAQPLPVERAHRVPILFALVARRAWVVQRHRVLPFRTRHKRPYPQRPVLLKQRPLEPPRHFQMPRRPKQPPLPLLKKVRKQLRP